MSNSLTNDGVPTPRTPETPPGPRKVVVLTPAIERGGSGNVVIAVVAAVVSVVAHAVMILLMMNVSVGTVDAGASAVDVESETRIEEPQKEDPELTNTDIGVDASLPTNYNTSNLQEVSVPGPSDPAAAMGILNAPEGPPVVVPPPPGAGNGTGSALMMPDAGTASAFGTPGGMGGIENLGSFKGRSGATREKLLQEGGGNARSEAAVARGLEWLSLHQAQGGQWSLDGFSHHAREKPYPEGKTFTDDSNAQGSRRNDIAGTAFGLLPFLAAGQTHKAPVVSKDKKAPLKDYHKGVDAGLKFLMGKQGKDGYYGGDMYSHSLAAIAMCEAYGLTSDPVLKVSAQKAINYLVDAQDPIGGGWRYTPKTAGDTSVTGWALMALKSGQMAGLSVPAATLRKVERFLDSVETPAKGGYQYLSGSGEKPAMTAVGMLCREYLGVRPQNTGLLAGVERLKKSPPGTTGNLYYEYYATQVMHHMGGESWAFWNQGQNGKPGIRDYLISKQDVGASGRKGNAGSWAPATEADIDIATQQGGRLVATSLSLLTLEVYYRHLPLYRREMAVMKEAK
jgi:hypothetical protein